MIAQAERLNPCSWRLLPSRRTFCPGRSACTPAVTTSSPPSRPCDTTMLDEPCRSSSTGRSDTSCVLGSTTQTAGLLSAMVSAVAGSSMPPVPPHVASARMTVAPSRMASGHSVNPTLTRKLRVTGIRLRCQLPHPPGGVDAWIVGQCDGDDDVGGDLAHEGGGHVEHRIDAVMLRDRHDHLAGPYDLAGLGAGGDHDTGGVRQQLGVAELILGRRAPGRRRASTVGLGGLRTPSPRHRTATRVAQPCLSTSVRWRSTLLVASWRDACAAASVACAARNASAAAAGRVRRPGRSCVPPGPHPPGGQSSGHRRGTRGFLRCARGYGR